MYSSINDIKELYYRYLAFHNLTEEKLPFKIFRYLVYVFPLLLVANADEYIDTTEQMCLDYLIENFLKDSDTKEIDLLKNRVRILALEIDLWKEPFMNVLKKEIQNNNKIAEILLDNLIKIAKSSYNDVILNIISEDKENFISKVEKEVILEILSELGIIDKDFVKNKLKEIL